MASMCWRANSLPTDVSAPYVDDVVPDDVGGCSWEPLIIE